MAVYNLGHLLVFHCLEIASMETLINLLHSERKKEELSPPPIAWLAYSPEAQNDPRQDHHTSGNKYTK